MNKELESSESVVAMEWKHQNQREPPLADIRTLLSKELETSESVAAMKWRHQNQCVQRI